MNIREEIYKELVKFGLSKNNVDLQEIRNKDGVYLYRIICRDRNYVLKYFLNKEYTREINNYAILKELNVPTIKLFNYTDRSLLLEDIVQSKKYRLGENSDLSDTVVAKSLALWYVDLHNKGKEYVFKKDCKLYRETDVITKDNINFLKNSSNTRGNKVWDLILENYDLIFKKINGIEETLTYNDFYWTNLAVSRDKKESLMFDYNLLGVGFRYSDIRNVSSSLSKEAGEVFIKEYGDFDEREKIIDKGISNIINLIFAYKRPQFPSWGKESLDEVYNGKLEKDIKKILELS